ncbi:MAG TPA: hypothetical protein VMT24_19950, partial [Aggregatilineaceae bacterium]|nr:hypothetical protein [Aggregatilineaceae bacterium]
FGPPVYVIEQYHDFISNIEACTRAFSPDFANFNGLFRPFGYQVPPEVAVVVCVLAGGVTLGLWWLGAKCLREPFRALWLLALTAGYLMLFNPMNELNSYVILAPAMGVWAVYAFRAEASRRFGCWAVFWVLSIGFLPTTWYIRPDCRFAPFWYPLAAALFLVFLAVEVWGSHKVFAETPRQDEHERRVTREPPGDRDSRGAPRTAT